MLLGSGVEFTPCRAAAAGDAMPKRVDTDRLHWGEVDHQAAVGQGGARVVVAAAAHGYLQPRTTRMSQGSHNILGGAATHHDGGPPLDGRVPDVHRVDIAVIPGHAHRGRRTDLERRHRCLLPMNVPREPYDRHDWTGR